MADTEGAILTLLCQELVRLKGENIIRSLQRFFGITFTEDKKFIATERLAEHFKNTGVNISTESLVSFCAKYDKNLSGLVAVHEVFQALRENGMSLRRKEVVHKAFLKLCDETQTVITLDNLRDSYNSLQHVTVVNKTGATQENWELFDRLFNYGYNPDGYLSREEFQAFYVGVSQLYKDDEEFEILLTQTWNLLEGTEGVSKMSEIRKKLPPGAISMPKRKKRDAPKRIVGYLGHIPGISEMFGITFDRCERSSRVPAKKPPLEEAPKECSVDYAEISRSRTINGNVHSYKLE